MSFQRHPEEPKLNAAETAKVAWLVARMAKRGLASEHVYQGDLERKVERVLEDARRRIEREAKEAAKKDPKAKAKRTESRWW